jgi:hypothetical protein
MFALAQVPRDCETCLYREEDWRDGGHCYMFREPPGPTCAQYRIGNAVIKRVEVNLQLLIDHFTAEAAEREKQG